MTVELSKTKFDYWIDGSLKKKNTEMVIAGKMQMPDSKQRDVKMRFMSNEEELPFQDLIIDPAGNFSFTLDTSVYDPSQDYQINFYVKGMQDKTSSFQPRLINSPILVNMETLPRGRHSINAGAMLGVDEFYPTVGYYYHHPSYGKNHLAFGGEVGYCFLKRSSHIQHLIL